MAYEYSNNEYTEMVRVLAKSHDNVARACHEFVKLFPNLPTPSRELMLQVTQRLRDHGQFHPSSSEMVSEEEEEGQEDGDDEEEDDEEGEDVEENVQKAQEGREEVKEEVPKFNSKFESMKSPVSLPAGKGFLLGHIRNVEVSLSRFKTQDQMILHHFLYGQLCPDRNVTGNIKNFKGFQWSINSTEYKAKVMETARMEPRQLRAMCEMLDLDKDGGPSELASRLMGFLQQPRASYPLGSRASHVDNKDPDEDYESDQETRANDSNDGSEESDDSTKTSGSEASDSGSEGEDVIGTEDREAEAKVIPDRQRPPPKNKKTGSDMLVRSANGEKASSEESYEGESSEEEKEERSDQEESGEESDTPADKKAKRPPTDEEIKKFVKQILEEANLEQITMKTVCKQVYSHYPDFDLAHKKDFIKATVKSLL